MKPTTTKGDKPSSALHARHTSTKSASHAKATLVGGIRKTKAHRKSSETYLCTRKSTRGDAGIRGHEMIGKYRTEITSSQGKRCGVFALEISTSKQLSGSTTLTPKVWNQLFRSDASRAWHQDKGWVGRDYEQEFHDEQLGLILYLWGREQGKTLQLGVAADGQDPFVLPLPVLAGGGGGGDVCASEAGPRETVWIHNDNAQLIMGRLCNHYSGITILGSFSA